MTEERLFRALCDTLATTGNVDYVEEVRSRFDRLVLLLIKFSKVRLDSQGSVFPYLRRIEDAELWPHERELQEDLANFLLSVGFVDLEKTNVASGRADIYLPQSTNPSFRFVIEVKRLLADWSEEALDPFLRQTTAYQQTDVRLGVLAVLDLSDRPAGFPHLDQCLNVRQRGPDSGADRRHVLVVRVPGNKRVPSDHHDPAT